MAEFQDVAKAYKRMCDEFASCINCPLYDVVKTSSFCANSVTKFYSEEAERIIMQWAKEHPLMTNRMKFREVFGFEFTDRVAESQYHSEWLDAEYKGGQE